MATEKMSVVQPKPERTSICCSHDSLFLLVMWTQILNTWDGHRDKQLASDLSYLHPIPDELRSTAWFIISGAQSLMNRHRNLYRTLSRRRARNECLQDIEKDLQRTFSSKSLTDRYRANLRRILVAYSIYNPSKIGYVQGMNFMASFILRQYFENAPPALNAVNNSNSEKSSNSRNSTMKSLDLKSESDSKAMKATMESLSGSECADDIDRDSESKEQYNECMEVIEEQCFWTFTAIMSQIGSLYHRDLIGFQNAMHCFEAMFNRHGPRQFVEHLSSEQIFVNPTILSLWFHSMFTHQSIRGVLTKRIWTIFIVEEMDFAVLLKVAFLIFMRHKEEFMEMDFCGITQFCQSTQWMFCDDGREDQELIVKVAKLRVDPLCFESIRDFSSDRRQRRNLKRNRSVERRNKRNQNNNNNDGRGGEMEQESGEEEDVLQTLWTLFKMFVLIPK